MKTKTQKWLIISAAALLCIVLVVLIATQFGANAAVPGSSSTSIVQEESSRVVRPATSKYTISHPIAILPEEQIPNTGSEQAIQPDVTKPEEPEPPEMNEDAKTNPDEVPVYTPEQTNPPASSSPQGGETNNGKIYVPGFGWIDEIGEGEGTYVDGDGDPNKQVGDM